MHTGQRDMIRIRISKDAFNAGFRAKHFGEVLYANVKNEFDAVVDKCASYVSSPILLSVPEFVMSWPYRYLTSVMSVLLSLTDESVDGILQLYHVPGILPEPCMCGNSGASGTVRCCFMAGCKSYQ